MLSSKTDDAGKDKGKWIGGKFMAGQAYYAPLWKL